MRTRPICQPLTDTDITNTYVFTLCRVSDRLAWSPSKGTFIAPGPYATPAAIAAAPAGSPAPANSDCYLPMLRCPDGLAANLIGVAPNVPDPAPGDSYFTIILDAAAGATYQGPTPQMYNPYDVDVSVAVALR